jgi:hypothetical protein
LLAEWQQGRAAPVGKQPEVSDSHESPRQHVQKEAAQKLLYGQTHQPLLVLMGRIPPTEGDAAVCQRDQPVVGNCHPMRVTAEIAQHVFGSSERALGIDHPIGAEQRAEHGRERTRRLKMDKAAVKPEFAGGVEFAETLHKLAAEHAAEHLHRQEEIMPAGNPACVIGC